MLISDAQREVRTVYLAGFVGQLVSALIWFASAAIATFVNLKTGFWGLAIGGAAIFPQTHAILRMTGRRAVLDQGNLVGYLAMPIVFTVPLSYSPWPAPRVARAGLVLSRVHDHHRCPQSALCLPLRNEDVCLACGRAHYRWIRNWVDCTGSDCHWGMDIGRGPIHFRLRFACGFHGLNEVESTPVTSAD
jgi:hypothetical protein